MARAGVGRAVIGPEAVHAETSGGEEGRHPAGALVKNPTADAGDTGSIPASGRCPGGGLAPHSSVLGCRTPWREEPGGLWSTGSQEAGCG